RAPVPAALRRGEGGQKGLERAAGASAVLEPAGGTVVHHLAVPFRAALPGRPAPGGPRVPPPRAALMCGIAGIWGAGNIEVMTRRLVHRGADDEGFYRDGPVQLSVRRLSGGDVGAGDERLST